MNADLTPRQKAVICVGLEIAYRKHFRIRGDLFFQAVGYVDEFGEDEFYKNEIVPAMNLADHLTDSFYQKRKALGDEIIRIHRERVKKIKEFELRQI